LTPLSAIKRDAEHIQGGPKKTGPQTIILSNLNRFTKFFTERFLGIFAVKKSHRTLHMLLHYHVKH